MKRMDATHKSKNANTYRFKSFANRLSEIDIRHSAIYYIGHENEELYEDDETYFHQALRKWMVLNLTDEFREFSRKCLHLQVVTLPQLIHKKDFVLNVLLEKLSTATTLSLQPLLELVIVLARDLREEFYPYFQRVLDRLICLLNTKDADQFEWTIICLAYLFKTLKLFLKRNISVVFNVILPLLDETRYSEEVTNFAVECFSFIARDIKDFKNLLQVILETVANEESQSIQGCGKLLFEIVRGVNGLFHSIAPSLLELLFQSLGDESLENSQKKSKLLLEIASSTVSEILKFIHPHNMTLFWVTICGVTLNTHVNKINSMIALILQAAQWKNGYFMTELDIIVSTVLKVIELSESHNDQNYLLFSISELVSTILLSENAQISQLDTSRLIKKMLFVDKRDVFEKFIRQIQFHPQFEVLVLPDVLRYFELYFDDSALEQLAQIVLRKSPLARNAQGLANWKQYPLEAKRPETFNKFNAVLNKYELSGDDKLMEQFILCLIISPHLKGLDTTELPNKLKTICLEVMKRLDSEKYLFLLSVVVEISILFKFPMNNEFLQKIVHSVGPLCLNQQKGVMAIGILDQVFLQKHQLFKGIDKLGPLLSSSCHEIRLITAHCLQTVNMGSTPNPYCIFYDAECITPTVNNFRDHIFHLQKLDPDGKIFKSISNEAYKIDILRFLLGMLYHNFKLIWEPVLNLIVEYAKILPTQAFWNVYKEKLDETVNKIKEISFETEAKSTAVVFRSQALAENQAPVVANISKQELLNYRNLLWIKLPQLGNICEIKNKDLVTMFLNFVNDEYKKTIEAKETTWDLSMKLPDYQIDEERIQEKVIEISTKQLNPGKSYNNRRGSRTELVPFIKILLETLHTKLGVFVSQANPKQMHREPELYASYMDLLAGPNAQLQKAALDCLISYKKRSWSSYKEHLYAFIDEKKFKDKLINFKLNTVHADHRPEFMQVFLRILYGKMITKTTQKVVGGQARKGMILRFLGECTTDEVFWFLKMAFGKYELFVGPSIELEDIPKLVAQEFSFKAVWSPKKLQSAINLLELIRKQFGGLMNDVFHLYMIKLITFVGSLCNEVINAANNTTKQVIINPKMCIIFKNIKTVAIRSLVNFFSHIEDFPWTSTQIACLTEVFIWGTVEKLSQESIHSPTSVLKLLLLWGESPKLFKYLAQERSSSKQVIFKFIIDLLLNDKAKATVKGSILALIERLLTHPALVCTAENSNSSSVTTITGVDIVRPYIPQILKSLKINFSSRSSRQSLDKRDLTILSLLTKLVEEPETCDSLLQLLLPILVAKSQSNASETVVCQVVLTLSNLILRLNYPESYICKVAPLFEHVHEVSVRKMLCHLIMDISKKRTNADMSAQDAVATLKETAHIINMLNSWDKRWVEQPDYEKRLDALKSIALKLEEGSVSLDLGVLVIYNCFYFIKYDKDIGLRDNAAEHLKLLVPKLVQRYADSQRDIDYLVGDVLLGLIRRTLRDSSEFVRNEGIRLLGEMVRQCSTSHQILQDLAPLADAQDVEVDFFENMIHLQSHRHGKALHKFCSVAETCTTVPNYRTLTQIILPLISRYLLNEKYAGKHTLIDAAIKAVGVVCQMLPWQHYLAILRFYLMKMRTSHEHQKECVRIVVRILDVFHFDLSQSTADPWSLNALKFDLKTILNTADQKSPKSIKNKIESESDVTNNDNNLSTETFVDLDMKNEEKCLDNIHVVNAIKSMPSHRQIVILPKSASKHVMHNIATILIPTLNRSITEKSFYDNKHKINRRRFSVEREDEEILRVPIALALVKLMLKLPKEMLDTSLPSVFMKVCTFLRSPLKSVRMLTRDILKKIMIAIGSSYLAMLMDHLTTLLTRGFQVHVLSVTVHGVLESLRDVIKPSDLESCLSNILEVALNDIFGEIGAEKNIEKIAAQTPEAKPSAKSFLVLNIVACNIQESCLLDLLVPFKHYLTKSHLRKMTLKIQDCFEKIVSGLVENPYISRESLLIFIYGTMSESISELLPGVKKPELSEHQKENMRRARPDCFIIMSAPRSGAGIIRKAARTNTQTNAHILIEFGLELLYIVLKKKKHSEIDYEPFLNPLLPLIRDALKSSHIRVSTFALKCLSSVWNNEYELPAIREYLDDIVTRIFEILHNFSTFGVTKQNDNFQLVRSTFKTVVALLRKCTDYQLRIDQVNQLVHYIEHDIHEGDNQMMALSLLKAMVARKVNSPEIHEVMKKLSEISIASQSDYVRNEARVILATYVMEYPLKKRIDSIIKFFTTQLCFSLPSGRLSAVRFLLAIITKFPQRLLVKNSEFLFLSLGTRLVNEEQPDCRAAVAECIEQLIVRLEKDDRQNLLDITLTFFDGDKSSIREMAAVLLSRFLAAEKQAFRPRVKVMLPVIVSRLTMSNLKILGRFVIAPTNVGLEIDNEHLIKSQAKKYIPIQVSSQEIYSNSSVTTCNLDVIELKQQAIDHELIQVQNCILKMLQFCTEECLEREELNGTVDELAYQSQKLLGYAHTSVRINAAKIISHILGTYDLTLVGSIIQGTSVNQDKNRDFIYLNPEYDIKSLVLDLCAQMVPGETTESMVDVLTTIFLFVGNMLKNVSFVTKDDDNPTQLHHPKIHLNWLVRNIRFLINKEVAKAPHSCIIRTGLFTLIESFITLFDVSTVKKLSQSLLSVLLREISEDDHNINANLRQLAIRVGNKLRKRIGFDAYDKLRANLQTKLLIRRADRKKVIAQEKIYNPTRAAKRKIGVQERKKASKKRKTAVIRSKADGLKIRKRKIDEDVFKLK